MPVGIRRTICVLSCISLTAAATDVAAQSLTPATVCRGGQRDEFDGAKLDRSRWTTVVRESPDLRIKQGHLVIPTMTTDIFGAGGSTENIVLQALPPGQFIATAKLSLAPRSAYQQAGLVVYGDDDNYIKLVFQARGDNDAESRRFEFFSERNGQMGHSLSPKLDAAYPDVVWVRLTSDGKTLRAAYSADGQEFTEMPETEQFNAPSVDGIAIPKIGLLSMAGTGAAPVIEAKFDWFELCYASGAR
jgi:cytochrome c